MDFSKPSTQRRRSERVSQSLPITVRGNDLLGQPFEEPTVTLSFNLHGCRYTSKHCLPKNSWVTLEVNRGGDCRDSRARVSWVQRPHSLREFFQVAVEFETPANLWSLEAAPSDWAALEDPREPCADSGLPEANVSPEILELRMENTSGNPKEKSMDDLSGTAPFSESVASAPAVLGPVASTSGPESLPDDSVPVENPLLRELSAELEQRARQAVDDAAARAAEQVLKSAESIQEKQLWVSEEAFRKWNAEFEREQNAAREQLAAVQDDLLIHIRSEFDASLGQAKRLIEEIEAARNALHAENDAAAEAASRVAQARLGFEALEAARVSQPAQEFPEEAAVKWRQRLESEMATAQNQWNELLQSSLDSGVQRIASQLAANSDDLLRGTETKIVERFNELKQPLLETLNGARDAAGGIRAALDDELARANASLAEIQQAAARMNDFPSQVDAASREALDELNQRLKTVLEEQTRGLAERADALASAAIEKAASSLESLGQQTAESAAAEIEAKLAPHLQRVPQILHELSSRELQIGESLRLHRERLRQLSERNLKELLTYLSGAVEVARGDLETTRKEAIAKWDEELDVCGARAAHAAADSIHKAAQWTEQDARARLQTLLEQTLTSAGTALDANIGEARQKLASELQRGSAAHAEQIQQRLDSFATDLTDRASVQIEQAAEAAASSFGQVLRSASDQEFEHFTAATLGVIQQRTQELDHSADQLLRNLGANAESSLANFQARLASQLESSVAQGRAAVIGEFDAALATYRSQQDSHQKQWAEDLDRLGAEAAARFQERLETACDSWMVSSLRRLNEHGQNAIESLMRLSDQALRDSCAKFFERVADVLRGSNTAADSSGQESLAAAAEAMPPTDSPNQS